MVELQYFGHSFFKLKNKSGSILIDPIFDDSKTKFKKNKKIPIKKSMLKDISLILLTSEMEEHFDKDSVEKIAIENNATVVANDFILTDLNIPRSQKASVTPNVDLFLKGYKITAMTAHCPQCFCPTGYLIEMDGKKVYHAGVTGLLESFSGVKADVVLLPMNGKSMDVVDVVRATKIMKPKTVIPMQYDVFDFGNLDPKELERRIKDSVLKTETKILGMGKKFKV